MRSSGRCSLALALVLAVVVAPVAQAGDRDGDGVSNKVDQCPEEVEDRDGYRDEDGCPDPSTRVNFVFEDDVGQPVTTAVSTVRGAGGEGTGAGSWTIDLHPGTYTLTAKGHGYHPHASEVSVPDRATAQVGITLERILGRVRVQVVDERGTAVTGATIRVGRGEAVQATGLDVRLPPGDHVVRVSAPDFHDATEVVAVEAEETHGLRIVLEPLIRDTDGDGVLDEVDACVAQAEDLDGFQDTDGCPDPTVRTTLVFRDEAGTVVRNLEARVVGSGGHGKGDHTLTLDLHPGTYEVFATAPAFGTLEQTFGVPAGVDFHAQNFSMTRVWTTLILYVMDDDGAPIDEFWWNLDNGENSPGDGGGLYAGKMDPGAHELYVYADGHAPAKARIRLEPRTFAETSITLYRTLIEVTPDKIEIADKVYFDTGKATIKPESYGLLDQVAAVMTARTDMLRVRVEGHTDARGGAAFNLQLSDDRAASVRAYLMEAGVAPERLTSVGFGEDQPVDDRSLEEAWERNRRVEFVIESWDDIKVKKEIEPRQATIEVKTTSSRPPLWAGFGVLDGSAPPHHQEILDGD